MKRIAVALMLLSAAMVTKAQEHRFGSWNEFAVSYDITKKWTLNAGETVRWYPYQSYETQWLTDVGIERELGDRFSITPSYRITLRATNLTQRLYCDLAYQVRPLNFQVTNRVRVQYQWDRYDERSHYLRNKLTVKYRKPRKVTPVVAGELFYRLGYEQYFVDAFRVFVGTDYKINKRWSVTAQFMREQEIQVRNPMTTDALQLGVEHEF